MARLSTLFLAVIALLLPAAASADVVLSGYLNDSTNTALVGSDLGTPLFDNDNDIANNVALYTLSVATAGNVEFASQGFATGGVDPYFTLFSGTGNSATFLGSNYTQAFNTGGDFDLTFLLGPGDYTVALGTFANMSFAENQGGTLGDGFIGLGEPGSLGNYFYKLDVTTPSGGTVPEPFGSGLALPSLLLAAIGLQRLRDRAGFAN